MGYIQIANPTGKEVSFGGIKVPKSTSILVHEKNLDKTTRGKVKDKKLIVLPFNEVEKDTAKKQAEEEAKAKAEEEAKAEAEAKAKAEEEAKAKAKAEAEAKAKNNKKEGNNSKNKG